jgi:allantoin racemase
MRILYQLTSPMEKTALGPGEVARRRAFLRERAGAGVEVDVGSLAGGPASIESSYEAALVVPELTEPVRRAQGEGWSAVIVGCFSDPGLDALRELVTIPVVGPGASAVHLAAQLGTRFSIISPLEAGAGRTVSRMRALGLAGVFASVRAITMPVLDVARQRDQVLDRLEAVGRQAIREDGADAIVLGCMSMGFLGLTDDLQKRIEVPVVNPVVAALKTAEALVAMGLSHSKAAYPMPPKELDKEMTR